MKLEIEKLDYEGRGLGHINGKVVFVRRALPKEIVEISLKEDKKRFSVGEVKEIIKPSESRLPSYCPYAKKCGGCTYDFISYEDSLTYKKEIIKDLFQKNEIDLPDFDLIPSRPVLGYRNKVTLHIKDGSFGYYEEESHSFVPIKNCFLVNPAIEALLKDFDLIKIQNGNIMIRTSETGELMLWIVTEDNLKISKKLAERHNIIGILWNNKCVYGKSSFLEEKDGMKYKVHANAFFQVNPYISEKIVKDVLTCFEKEDDILDLYCGVGFFSLRLAKYTHYVTGIELDQNAILDAKKNAYLNHLENVSFHVGKVEDILKKISMKKKKIIVDPPRSGLHKTVINIFLENKPEKIVYISCNPITLVRDLKLLLNDYQITFFRTYDMFAYTKHVECVCVLSKR